MGKSTGHHWNVILHCFLTWLTFCCFIMYFITFLHIKGPVALSWWPQTLTRCREWLGHFHSLIVTLASLFIDKTPVFRLITIHMFTVHFCHKIFLWSFCPGCNALQFFRNTLWSLHINAGLKIELELVVVGAGVKITWWKTASVQAWSSLGVAECKWSPKWAFYGLRISAEHCVHLRITSNIFTQGFKGVKVSLTIA